MYILFIANLQDKQEIGIDGSSFYFGLQIVHL